MEDLKPKIDELKQASSILESQGFEEACKVILEKMDEYERRHQLQEAVKEWWSK